VVFAAECGAAQEAAPSTPAQSINDALHAMTQLAGVIFTGQVVGVRRLDGVNGATGVVEITFAVEDAVRGVSGGTYTLREWAGLWPAGDEPFGVGQRFLMLLHAPSAAGLSSPVGGMDGAIPIRGSAAAVEPQSTASGTSSARIATGGTASESASALADGRVVDLRWVGTHVVQTLSYRTEAEARAVSARADAAPVEASQGAAYATVMGMLRGWEKVDHAAR
jgi:hypothetical protein